MYVYNKEIFKKKPKFSSLADEILIDQRDIVVMRDEIVRLTCGIQYRVQNYQKQPTVFWFNDIRDVKLTDII